MIWKALGQADPKRAVAGWGKNAFPVTSGRTDAGETWVMYNWGGNAGAGAVAGRDGFNQMGPMVTLGGLVLPNAETYEQLYPVHVVRQELRTDGGGAGQWRGGTGIDFEARIDREAEVCAVGFGDEVPSLGEFVDVPAPRQRFVSDADAVGKRQHRELLQILL